MNTQQGHHKLIQAVKKKNTEGCSMCECISCCKHIPLSSALTPEGVDYVSYFCSTACYEKWQNKKKEQSDEKTNE